MTRIALLTREYPPYVYGGAGVHVEYLAPALADLVGVEVHCFDDERDDPLVAGTYEPWDLLAGEAPELAALRTISADLAMVAGVHDVDLVHSHTWYANLAGHLAKLVRGIPHVMTTHSLEPLRPWKREQLGGGYELSRFCEATAMTAADAVIAVSDAMRDDVLASYPQVQPERVHVVHNAIDAQVYRPVEETDALDTRGIDRGRTSVVFVGRITRQKGLAHLLGAARHLPRETQLVVCAGAPDTEQIAQQVRVLIDELRAAGRDVVWIEQMMPRREVAQILTHATVFVCPSIYEPFGLVNLEAMACATAVVATDTGGIPEIVVDGETGLLVAYERHPEDPDGSAPAEPESFERELAARICELLDDPDRARRFGEAGRARVLERFTWDAVARRTVEIYESVLTGAR